MHPEKIHHFLSASRYLLSGICALVLLMPLNYAYAQEEGEVCEIDQKTSKVVIRVYKEGRLSAFGDNHLISTSILEGRLGFSPKMPKQSSILLAVPTQSLIVNDPGLRATAEPGFNSKVSTINRRITRRSMLGKKVLYAKKYPRILIQSLKLPPRLSGVASMAITLRDTTQNEEVKLQTTIEDNTLRIQGQFDIKQSDYGIVPFSIMFGGIRVKDTLRLDFDLRSQCSIT